jgi:hypothetical protein
VCIREGARECDVTLSFDLVEVDIVAEIVGFLGEAVSPIDRRLSPYTFEPGSEKISLCFFFFTLMQFLCLYSLQLFL